MHSLQLYAKGFAGVGIGLSKEDKKPLRTKD